MVVAEVCSSMKYPKRCQYKHAKQKKYHVRNWAEYNEGLRRRGDLTVWFDEEAIANWKADKTGKPGGQRVYSDMAIETGLVVRMVYKLAYRQTEGFLHSIASLLGLGIEIPDYSTLCRRSRLLRKKLRIPKAASTQPIHLMIDSTGLRIHGRCCTALAESEIRLWWWPRYVSSMKYPKRCQYKHAKQKKYHVRNWAEYNEGLRRRGDLTVWFDEEAIANWKADKTGKPGGQRVYSDMAIETGLVVRMVYKLAYRQTEGFLHSIASLLGLGIEIPDYSTLCRRSRLLRKKLRIPKAASTQPIHLMIDSTGLRIHVGNARKPPKQRAWRKLHIAVDRETGNIVASELTASRARDATRVPALLTQIQAPLVSVAADSAYDKEAVYEAIEAHSPGRRTRVVIPPQRNATLNQNSNTAMQERDRHIRAIERHGRREWYKLSGYTKRSMVENAVYRYKAIIGPEMRARTLARQRVEHRIGCEILNKMAALGMPDTYCAG